MKAPLTNEKTMRRPMLYRGNPDIRSQDVKNALEGLRGDVDSISDKDMVALINEYINTWFPAFTEP